MALGTVGGEPAGDIPPDRIETVDGIAFRIQTAVELVAEPTPGQAASGANSKRVTVRVTPQVPRGRTFTDQPGELQRTLRAGEPWQPAVWMYTPITVVAEVLDGRTGAAPTTPVTVALTTPGGGRASMAGTGGAFAFTEVVSAGAAHPIAPSVAAVTLVAAAECYDIAQVSGPAPADGYPAVTTATFQLRVLASSR